MKSVVMVPWKLPSGLKSSHDEGCARRVCLGGDQATGGPLDPEVDALKWMKEHQHSYMDVQLNFWLLLWPLTDGSEESSWHLTCRLLSMWHWASALDLPTCPPAPSSLNIGHWLQEDPKVDERQRWIKAYACSLQCIVEASVGCTGPRKAEQWLQEVSNLVETFMATTGMHISLHIVRECWPLPWEETPSRTCEGCERL